MKTVIRVGQVSLVIDGLELKRREIRALMFDVAAISATLGDDEPERPPVGFSATIERADDPPAESYYTDDDPE